MDFIHGIEVVEVNSGIQPISVVLSSVIGLVGIAPKGPINTVTAIYNDVDAAQFGKELDGFSIPRSLSEIFTQGGGPVLVVNVFDPDTMTATVTAEEQVVASQKIQLDFAPIGETITLTGTGGTPTYTAGTQYTVDEFGLVSILDTATILNGATVEATYEKLDASTITSSTIIGAVSGAGVRTGIQEFYNSYMTYGFNPKILIAPEYSQTVAIADALNVVAAKLFSRSLRDEEVGTTIAEAISGRTTLLDPFFIYEKRVALLFPHIKISKPSGDIETRPYSATFAGLWSYVAKTLGYHYSPSNKPMAKVVGLEQPVSFNPASPLGTDANNLNAQGIITAGRDLTRGFISWGNYSSAFPESVGIENFLAVLLTADVIDESIVRASIQQFTDSPITIGGIDFVTQTTTAFLNSQIQRGILLDGVGADGRPTGVYFDAAKNPVEQLALGHVVFTVNYCPPPPAQRTTYDRFIDISFLSSLTAQ
jgi:uncharacterized protein